MMSDGRSDEFVAAIVEIDMQVTLILRNWHAFDSAFEQYALTVRRGNFSLKDQDFGSSNDAHNEGVISLQLKCPVANCINP